MTETNAPRSTTEPSFGPSVLNAGLGADSGSRYLTIVYLVPKDFDVSQLTEHKYVSAMTWGYGIGDRL